MACTGLQLLQLNAHLQTQNTGKSPWKDALYPTVAETSHVGLTLTVPAYPQINLSLKRIKKLALV